MSELNAKIKIAFFTNISIGIVISLALSLAVMLVSGHFSFGWWVAAFLISTVISAVIGLFVPINPITGFVCKKLKIKEKTVGRRITGAVISDLIYVPVITLVVSLFAVGIASHEVENFKNDIKSLQSTLREEIREDNSNIGLLSEQLEIYQKKADNEENRQFVLKLKEGINTLNSAVFEKEKRIDEMSDAFENAAAPSLGFVFGISLLIMIALGFVLIFVFRPIFARIAVKRFSPKKCVKVGTARKK